MPSCMEIRFSVSSRKDPHAPVAGAVASVTDWQAAAIAGGGMTRFRLAKRVGMVVLATAIASSAQTLTTLVSFDGTNGGAPAASLIQASDGNLYGTTEYGGPISGCEGGFNPCGTVFKITRSGTLTTLHTFVYSDGAFPVSPVVQGTRRQLLRDKPGRGGQRRRWRDLQNDPQRHGNGAALHQLARRAGARP